MLTGGCHCGAIRYEVEGAPIHAALCHCTDCRRQAGAPMVSWTLFDNDHFRLTPQITFISGSQKFGFNQSSNTYGTTVRTGSNVLYSSENYYLDSKFYYQPLSLSFYLRPEYSIGKFYIQPQLVFDYYFPATEKRFSSFFSLSTGFIF